MAKTKTTPADAPAPAEPEAAYTVVARRYRPQQFADLIGQEHVALALTNAITSGRIAHAFLFTGARGTGKTSTARILAKALNCIHGPTVKPCDKCDLCLGIIDGGDVDVSEIDGASNNKVDEIRDLKANVGFRPQHGRFKIYIIDEVHMLTTAAFNALLKTLEEPPAHVKFILATTEVQKIPITILSRCQRYDFAAIGPAKVFATLRHIVAKEGLAADDEALHLISRRAAGSMRDAQTLLDQLLGYCDGTLTAAKIHALLGSAADERIALLAEAILAGDGKAALAEVNAASEAGLQLGELLDQLIDYWRGLMLVHVAGPDARDLPGSLALQAKLREQVTTINLETVLAGLDILTTAKSKARTTSYVQILVEMTVVRLSLLEQLLSVATLTQMLAGRAVPVQLAAASPQAGAVTTASSAASKKNERMTPEPVATSSPASLSGDLAEATLPAVWAAVLGEVGMIRGRQLEVAGLPAIIGPNSLAIRFPSGYSSEYNATAAPNAQEVILRTLKKIVGRDCLLRVEAAAEELRPTARAGTAPTEQRAAPGRQKDLLQLPLFVKAADVLGAQLMKVDDGFNPFAAVAAAVVAAELDDADPALAPAATGADDLD